MVLGKPNLNWVQNQQGTLRIMRASRITLEAKEKKELGPLLNEVDDF